MIDLYTWFTPNGRKVSIMLEEIGMDYNVHVINISKGEQHDPDFLKIAPNNKIPVIVDSDNGMTLMETGAILQYLAKKSGQLMPTDEADYWDMQQWLMFQMASVGPMLGQVHSFVHYGEGKNAEASERYLNECKRIYGVMNKRLADRDWFVGGAYSIVDIAIFPWTRSYKRQNVLIEDYPNVVAWRKRMIERPAVATGMQAGAEYNADLRELSPEEWKRLFGA